MNDTCNTLVILAFCNIDTRSEIIKILPCIGTISFMVKQESFVAFLSPQWLLPDARLVFIWIVLWWEGPKINAIVTTHPVKSGIGHLSDSGKIMSLTACVYKTHGKGRKRGNACFDVLQHTDLCEFKESQKRYCSDLCHANIPENIKDFFRSQGHLRPVKKERLVVGIKA